MDVNWIFYVFLPKQGPNNEQTRFSCFLWKMTVMKIYSILLYTLYIIFLMQSVAMQCEVFSVMC